jgi:hypothetical protein
MNFCSFLGFNIFDLFNRGSNHRENREKPQGTDIKHVLKFVQTLLFLFSLFNFHFFLEFLLKIYIWEVQKQ